MLPATVAGQNYAVMWKEADEAAAKDLPKTRMEVLDRIAAMARSAGDYGHLIKAELLKAKVQATIAPDSLAPAVRRLERSRVSAADAVLRAVYAAVLYRIYTDNPGVATDAGERADSCRRMAMEDPAVLAAVKVKAFEPMVVDGYNGKIFNDDMLSVVGYEVGDYAALHEYYRAAGNRRAACIAALETLRQRRGPLMECVKKSGYVRSLDSLVAEYADLDVACEVAIERYDYMLSCRDVTVEDKISYINYALDKWGGWQGAGRLRNAERELTAPQMCLELERSVIEPGIGQMVRLRAIRNLKGATLNIYRVDADGDIGIDPSAADGYRKLQPLLSELEGMGVSRSYLNNPKYQLFEDSMALPGLPAGVYMLEIRSSPATETLRRLYYVTDMYLMSQELPGRKIRYVAVSATTGQPVAGAKVRLDTYDGEADKYTSVILDCGDDGETVYAYVKRRPDKAYVYTSVDRFCPNASAYGAFEYYAGVRKEEQTRVFTDRSVYRPGQAVHVAAVVTECDNYVDYKAVEGKTVKAMLRDANFKVVAEKELVTDAYGTCSTDFVLPAGTLTGRFTVMVNNSSAGIRVEEYKRPTFRVEFPKVNERYEPGDTLVVKARAVSFADVPVQGARVRYTVSRQRAGWWMPADGQVASADIRLWQGETVTDADGTFTVIMPLELPDGGATARMFCNIVAGAEVTDVSGETRTGSLSVPLGSRPTSFDCDLVGPALADSLRHVTFTLCNASGEGIRADVRFRLDDSPHWTEGKTGEPISLAAPLASGRHRLFAVCEADTIDRRFVVFSLRDTVPCVDTCSWFYASADRFPANGQPVTVQVGSSDEDVHVVYSIFSGDRVIESGATDISNRLINRSFTYNEEYGNGLLLTYAWVKDGRCHTYKKAITRPLPDRHLQLKWITFRDRLAPGQQEEWRLSVTMPDGTPADAQLMATLYDKSLDGIARHSWSMEPRSWLPMPYAVWSAPQRRETVVHAEQSWKAFVYRMFAPNRFDGSVFPASSRNMLLGMGTVAESSDGILTRGTRGVRQQSMSKASASIAAGAVVADVRETEADGGESLTERVDSGVAAGVSANQMRENLTETAFFMPALETDSTGVATLKFTLPESITTWRFMGIAHTPDMFVGSIDGEAVARKDVMIQPNVPRFVRVGDEARITAKVFNTGTTTVAGTARMQLVDPETERVVLERADRFSVGAGATASVAFDYVPTATYPLLICRVTASGKGFSDGEQHYLPILPERERVTVAVSFAQHEPGTKSVRIDTMFAKGGTDARLTIEYANNPAWMVVQALPAVGTPAGDNGIDQAAAYYANALGRHLATVSPRIKTVFDGWRMELSEERTLTSSLAKNKELKDIVLSETPWVADADRENEQKQRLADFFDETLMAGRLASAVGKLRSLQNADGAWGWCPGMAGSLHVTLEVAEMLVRLNRMAGRQEPTRQMLDKAFAYMDRRFVEKVTAMKDAEKHGNRQAFPGTDALRYLYLYSIDDRAQSAAVGAAIDYLVGLLEKDVESQTIYDKALTAVVLAKRGDGRRGREYVRSLKEYTVFTEEAGRYYDTPRASYSWRDYRIPTEVAAIEAMAMITPDDTATIDEMRRWLLHEKRAQAWTTPINSVNAAYAFLNGRADLLASTAETAFAIDGKAIDTPRATMGMGYVKATVNEVGGTTFTAEKTSQGTSWGALYAQYMQKTEDVEASASGISISREFVADSSTLHVGDRVRVRITIRAGRDLDFVHVADRRAACMEPAEQISGYRNGAYCTPKDNATHYYFDRLAKGTHVIETTYYIDRAGRYETGTCAIECVYAPDYRATAPSLTVRVEK